jgi:ketosteroid isomerase-like protein
LHVDLSARLRNGCGGRPGFSLASILQTKEIFVKKTFLTLTMLAAASLLLISCGAPAANNAANKPANAPANNSNAAPANAAAAETEIKKNIADVYAALAKNDAATLDKLYDDKYVLVDLDGSVKTKAERLAELKSGDVKFESITADEISVRTNPDATGAISIARAMAKSVNKGVASEGPVRVTTIWTKTKDGWKAVGAQATRITAADTKAKADDKKADATNANTAPANAAPANK